MNDEPTQEKDFISLIAQFNMLSETRDKLICEIDDILDRIKQNRRGKDQPKSASVNQNPPVVIMQLRELIQKVDLSNENLALIIRRLNELV